MNSLFRTIYSMGPTSVRVRFGRAWRLRGLINRLRFRQSKVDDRLSQTKIFFLLGSGRCGTLLISRMLNKSPGAVVLHEPHRHCDLAVRADCRQYPEKALYYTRKFRKYEIFKKIRERHADIYGEISSPLRCLGGALAQTLPNAQFMILVRDGRATIRSAMNRQLPKKGKHNHPLIMPLPDDQPYFDRWENMTDFEKTCWWWMDCYRTLLNHLPDSPIVHFERITKEYDYVREHILEPVGLKLTQQQYDESMGKKSANAAQQYTIPHWNDWDETMRKHFDEICGETMQRLGYERQW